MISYKTLIALPFALWVSLSLPQAAGAEETQRLVLGWVERVELYPESLLLDAKLTPGSEGNVLHAEDISEFKKGKSKWVRFSISDRLGATQTMERRVIDTTRVVSSGGKRSKRYVVELGICLHKKYMVIEFGLADRSAFEHKVRIGREALAGNFVIDPATTKTHPPKCKKNNAS